MFKSAAELASLVRDRHIGAPELVEIALEEIARVDPAVGAFDEVDADGAMAQAHAVAPGDPRPFAGVPIGVKANVPVRGRLVTMGSRALADLRARHDAYLVRRLRDAGFVIVGITRMPEFGILPTTEPVHGGPCRNPWDLERTPGGSSGGSAAAVAAGMLPLAHGNDGGGSLRIPAACCGLLGLKPSRGRVSRGPDLGDSTLGAEGVLTRTVQDTAMLLDVLAGYEVGDATWATRPTEPYHQSMRRDPGRLRVAIAVDNPLGQPIHEDSRAAVAEVADLLSELGHDVVDAAPELPDGEQLLAMFLAVYTPHITLGMEAAKAARGRDLEPGEIEPLSRAVAEAASGVDAVQYLTTMTRLQAIARQAIAFWADHDVLVSPVLAERPLPIGECHGSMDEPMAAFLRAGAFAPYPALFNVTGQPAIAVPLGFGADGLPTSVQIAGRPLGEDTLLQIAGQIEKARPWAGRHPEPAPAGATR